MSRSIVLPLGDPGNRCTETLRYGVTSSSRNEREGLEGSARVIIVFKWRGLCSGDYNSVLREEGSRSLIGREITFVSRFPLYEKGDLGRLGHLCP